MTASQHHLKALLQQTDLATIMCQFLTIPDFISLVLTNKALVYSTLFNKVPQIWRQFYINECTLSKHKATELLATAAAKPRQRHIPQAKIKRYLKRIEYLRATCLKKPFPCKEYASEPWQHLKVYKIFNSNPCATMQQEIIKIIRRYNFNLQYAKEQHAATRRIVDQILPQLISTMGYQFAQQVFALDIVSSRYHYQSGPIYYLIFMHYLMAFNPASYDQKANERIQNLVSDENNILTISKMQDDLLVLFFELRRLFPNYVRVTRIFDPSTSKKGNTSAVWHLIKMLENHPMHTKLKDALLPWFKSEMEQWKLKKQNNKAYKRKKQQSDSNIFHKTTLRNAQEREMDLFEYDLQNCL